LFSDEIFVFTPKGELRVLPNGATTLDFAFDIHTQIGMSCIGAKVNGKLMPLSHTLKSGDQVEVIRSSKQKPKQEWLKYVVTARAKQQIKAALRDEEKKIAADGKEILQRKFKQQNIEFNSENVAVLQKVYNIPSATELYFQIAKGKLDLKKIRELDIDNKQLILPKNEVVKKLNPNSLKNIISCVDSKNDTLIIGEDFKDLEYTLAQCCTPIPGDDVFGFITKTEGIKIHRTNCPNATQMMSNYAYRVIKATWQSQKLREQLAVVIVKGIDDMGIVNKITNIISQEHNVNMKSISFNTHDGVFDGKIELFVYDTEHLEKLITHFEQIEGVQSVERE
jgi:GTP pyrophosphokinase